MELLEDQILDHCGRHVFALGALQKVAGQLHEAGSLKRAIDQARNELRQLREEIAALKQQRARLLHR